MSGDEWRKVASSGQWRDQIVSAKSGALILLTVRRAEHRVFGEVNNSLGVKRVVDWLIRVDMRWELPEDAEEQSKIVSPKERRWEDPPTPPPEDCEAFHRRLILAWLHPLRRPLRAVAQSSGALVSSCCFVVMASSRLIQTRRSTTFGTRSRVSAFTSSSGHNFKVTLTDMELGRLALFCHFALDMHYVGNYVSSPCSSERSS